MKDGIKYGKHCLLLNTRKTMFRIMLLFPITTLFQSHFDVINKVVFGVLFLFIMLVGYNKILVKKLWILGATLISYIVTLALTAETPQNINELFYFPFIIVYFLYATDNMEQMRNYIENDKKYAINIVRIWTMFVGVSFFIPSSYKELWGGATYFSSFCEDIFRLGPTCVFILTLSICFMNIYKKKQYIVYSIIPLVCLYLGGSRTYFGIGVLLFVLAWYYFFDSRTKFYIFLIPLVALLAYFLFYSSIMDKIVATSYTSDSYYDYWATITNGRSLFWEKDMVAFWDSSFLNKMFGNGLNYIYDVNRKAIGKAIWAHNDFIQLLVSHGILGFVLYLVVIGRTCKNMKIKNYGIIPVGIVLSVWLINAFFNMFYTYFCSLLSFPFLIVAVLVKGRKVWKKRDVLIDSEENLCSQ